MINPITPVILSYPHNLLSLLFIAYTKLNLLSVKMQEPIELGKIEKFDLII